MPLFKFSETKSFLLSSITHRFPDLKTILF